ncbi:MAG: hypothetical protein WD423_00295 [Rhodothermales bacterium]
MNAGYRNADIIELHDAGVVIHVENLPREELGWRDSPTVVGKRLSIAGNELGRLLHAVGMSFDADALYDDEFDVVFHRPMRLGEEKLDVALEDTLRIKELLARVDGPHLLQVHVTSHAAESADEFVQELTYTGSFTVWWTTAEG